MLTQTPLQKFVWTAILWLFITGVLAVFFFRTSGQILHFRGTFQTTQETIRSVEEKRKEVAGTATLFQERQTDFERLKIFFPERTKPVRFIEYLEALGRTLRTPLGLSVDEGRSTADGIFLQLSAEGEDKRIRAIVRMLPLLPYDISVQEIGFKKISAENSSTGLASPSGSSAFSTRSRLSVAFIVKTMPR